MRDTIVRWDPFRDLVSIQDELNRLFGRTFTGVEPTRPTAAGNWTSMDAKPKKIQIKAEA